MFIKQRQIGIRMNAKCLPLIHINHYFSHGNYHGNSEYDAHLSRKTGIYREKKYLIFDCY